jgi:hypothetical protein
MSFVDGSFLQPRGFEASFDSTQQSRLPRLRGSDPRVGGFCENLHEKGVPTEGRYYE